MNQRLIVSDETEKRLQDWACWAKSSGKGMGYPRHSVEGRLCLNGGALTKQAYKPDIYENGEAEEIENLVILMGKTLVTQAEVIKIEYLEDIPIELKAKRLMLSRFKYMLYRDSGKSWLEGQLQAHKEYKLYMHLYGKTVSA